MAATRFDSVRWVRDQLGKSQSQMARLLGVSTRAVQSYEQGWRKTPSLVAQRAALVLYLSRRNELGEMPPCWEVRGCPPEEQEQCPTHEMGAGDLCWMLPSSRCKSSGAAAPDKQLVECEACPVMQRWLPA